MTIGDYTLGLSTTDAWLSILLLAALSSLAVRAYRPSRVSNPVHLALFVLRFLVLASAALLLMAPRLAISVNGVRLPLLAVLVDDSESMRIQAGERPRFQAITDMMADGPFDRISERARVQTFHFSEQLSERLPTDTSGWQGPATDIATSLQQLSGKLQGQGLAGVFLLSDGAHNLGQAPLSTAEVFPAPIYAVPVGSDRPPRDIALASASHPTLGYVGRPIEIRVSIDAVGLERAEQVVRVYDGQRSVAVVPIAIGSGRQEAKVSYTPDQPGERTLRVVIPAQDDEVESRNNEVLTTIEILDGRARVLLVGTPSADFAFLRRVIEADSNVVLDTVDPDTNGGWGFRARTALSEAGEYELVVLHDVPDALLSAEAQTAIGSAVRSGGALLLVGGEESLVPGWGSGLSDLVPVTYEAEGYTYGAYSAVLSQGADRHPITRLSDDSVADNEGWTALPPFLGQNSLRVRSGGATRVLLESDELNPLMVIGNVGRGKVAVFAARGFARQGLMMWGIGGSDRVVRSFWEKTLRWLLTKETVEKLRLTTEKRTYRSGEPIVFRAEFFDALLRPVDGAEVLIDIENGPSGATIMPGRGGGAYEVRAPGMPQGRHAYTVTASTRSDGPVVLTGEVTVGRYSVEFENLLTNAALMDELARRSGGRSLGLDVLPAFLNQMKLSPQPHVSVYQLDLWGRGWPLAVLVAGLAAEWFVRRRRGMV